MIYLGTEWANNPVIKSDIGVAHFLDSVGGYRHPERRDMLLDLLDVDLDWYVVSPSSLGWYSDMCLRGTGECTKSQTESDVAFNSVWDSWANGTSSCSTK